VGHSLVPYLISSQGLYRLAPDLSAFRRLRLRAVIALDDDEVAFAVGATHRHQALIFRRIVAGERGVVVPELDDDVARARGAFLLFEMAGADQEPRAVFMKDRAVLGDILLVAVHVVNIDPRDPVCLGHPVLPYLFALCGDWPRRQPRACSMSAMMACAAAFGSAAAMIGRPTTR